VRVGRVLGLSQVLLSIIFVYLVAVLGPVQLVPAAFVLFVGGVFTLIQPFSLLGRATTRAAATVLGAWSAFIVYSLRSVAGGRLALVSVAVLGVACVSLAFYAPRRANRDT
jgi:hypothetical protein